jgi:hypothetical protein
MAISFPVPCPTHLAPNGVRWSYTTANLINSSPTTFQQTIYEYDGELWRIDVTYPPLTRAEAAPFHAFLASLRGASHTFLFGDTLMNSPLGAGGGTPLVNGSNQYGSDELVTDGWLADTLVLKAGDMFSVDNRLYLVLQDVTSDASGNATIDIFPRARNHEDDSSIETDNPKGTFRLANEEVTLITAPQNQLYSIQFAAVEAL